MKWQKWREVVKQEQNSSQIHEMNDIFYTFHYPIDPDRERITLATSIRRDSSSIVLCLGELSKVCDKS